MKNIDKYRWVRFMGYSGFAVPLLLIGFYYLHFAGSGKPIIWLWIVGIIGTVTGIISMFVGEALLADRLENRNKNE